MTTQDIRQRLTVMISVEGAAQGTGFFALSKDGKTIYLLTARHVFENKGKNLILDPGKIQLFSDVGFCNGDNYYQISKRDAIYYSEEDDLLLIKIYEAEKLVSKTVLEQINFINDNHTLVACEVRGFPVMAQGASKRIKCQFEEFRPANTKEFSLHTLQVLQGTYADAESNMKGLSGAAVFFEAYDKIYVLGVVTDYHDPNTFFGIRLQRINALLQKNNLPELTESIPMVNEQARQAIKIMAQNEKAIKAKIQTTIGGIHIERAKDNEILELLGKNNLLVLHGGAGAGKSAFARDIVQSYEEEKKASVFLFTGEQFSAGTLDLVLQKLGIELSFTEILNQPQFGVHKIMWIESLEKLLESGDAEAFEELLKIVNADPSLKLIVTVRNYSLQQFLFRFGWHLPKSKALAEVKPFDERELAEISGHFLQLVPLLANQKIAPLLKNPFYLRNVVSILPQLSLEKRELDESLIKKILWDEIIDVHTGTRGRVFEDLAVKRAKEMRLFTTVEVDPEILKGLYRDHLITRDEELGEQYAPAHDVLEDWALTRYIVRHKSAASSAKQFFDSIGVEPAIRRAFRLWLSEELHLQKPLLNAFLNEAIADGTIEPFWKNEIYISIFRSPYSAIFFSENEAELLERDGAQALALLHLLRTTCKEPATGFSNLSYPLLLGSGWESFVRFFYQNRDVFVKSYPQLLSFLLDWRAKIQKPLGLPGEAREAGLLLLEILGQLKSGYHGNWNRRLLDGDMEAGILVAFKLTSAIKEEIKEWVRQAKDGIEKERKQNNYYVANFYEKILEYALDGVYCFELAIYHPDLLIDLVKTVITAVPVKGVRNRRGFLEEEEARHEIETEFGLRDHSNYRFSPESAYQTPIYYLLWYHPNAALSFILETINEATVAYSKTLEKKGRTIMSIELTLNDDTVVKQYGDETLWSMYRGVSTTPPFLQSMLMALERYLFELAEAGNSKMLHSIFDACYTGSVSVATTAVLCSVAMAYPKIVGKDVLPLLSDKHVYLWDLSRFMGEVAHSTLLSFEKDVHYREREESNKRPHRKIFKGLVNHVLSMLLNRTDLSETIFSFFDRFNEEAGSNEDILWSKTLSEMDIRKWEMKPDPEVPNRVLIQPKFEGAVKEFVEGGAEEHKLAQVEAGYSNWINGLYQQGDTSKKALEGWREIYGHYSSGKTVEHLYAKLSTLAILGLRDFYGKLTRAEKKWAVERIYQSLNGLAKDHAGDSRGYLDGTYNLMEVEPCFSFLPNLFRLIKTKSGIRTLRANVLNWLMAPLHDREKQQLLSAIRFEIFKIDPAFGKKCVYLLIQWAKLAQENDHWHQHYQTDEAARERTKKRLLSWVLKSEEISINTEGIALDYASGSVLRQAFALIPSDTEDLELIDYCIWFTKAQIEVLKGDRYEQRDHSLENKRTVQNWFPSLVLYLEEQKTKEFIDFLFRVYDEDPHFPRPHFQYSKLQEFLISIVEGLIYSLDSKVGSDDEVRLTENFWKLFSYLHKVNKEKSEFHFASPLLLEIKWKPEAKKWKPLNGKGLLLTEFIQYYGQLNFPGAIALLASIGDEVLMPQGITLIAKLLRDNPYLKIFLYSSESVQFIRRSFFEHGKTIKANGALLADFIFILDLMVEAGLNEAFLIRDYLISFKVGAF
jgi:hypothetical protein